MKFKTDDNTNAAEYAGHELVDTSTVPHCTFAIAMPKEYADAAVIAMNAHQNLVKALMLCEKALADYGDRHHGGIKFDACIAARKALADLPPNDILGTETVTHRAPESS